MNALRYFVLVALAAAVAAASAQQVVPTAAPAGIGAKSAASVPDFSGIWRHGNLPWFIPPASGPGPVTNLSREKGSGVSDYASLVGDYKNPILQPWASEVVKKFGELSLKGVVYGNPSNQCWPMPMPFIYKQFLVQIIQQPDAVQIIYTAPSTDIRRVRLNDRHPEPLTPSWYGDSVGHYEGDTLVIDTVGVKTDRPYAMLDLFGTPYTKSLHIVERYRLREYDDVKDAIERNKKENWLVNGDVFSKHRGKFLQLHLTIEDEGVFTTPWTSTITYVPGPDVLGEVVCADNVRQYYYDRTDTDVPRTEKPDF
jgi:hypothetical protein